MSEQNQTEKATETEVAVPAFVMFDLSLDGDDYPTEDSLEYIKNYSGDWRELLLAVADVYPEYGHFQETEKHKWKVSTGGWSGCEDIIGALSDNKMFWLMCWKMSRRGGYFEFETKRIFDETDV